MTNIPIDFDIMGSDKVPPAELKKPELTKKTVLLLASEDHELFTQAVEKLGEFLRVHCMCHVIFAPQQMPQLRKAGNSYCWLSRQIDSVDFVVIVTSEAALQLFLAYRKGHGYTKAALGPEGDLFMPGLQHICGKIANNEDVRNVVMVYFDHTSPSCRLPIAPLPSSHYKLPDHLPAFLHLVHDLDKSKMDLSQVNLPLLGNVEELREGKEWLDAVQEAKNYEKHNPKWFEQKFGVPSDLFPSSQTKPDYTKQESEVSGDSGYIESRNSQEIKRRLSSASNNAGDMEEADMGMDNASFTKDDFFPPSMITKLTAYTVPYPHEHAPSEIDDRSLSLSEEFHRFNQRSEQEQYHREYGLQGESSEFYAPQHGPYADKIVPTAEIDGCYVNFVSADEDHDCISVTSAQSV